MTGILTRIAIVLLAVFFDLATCVLVSAAIALLWPGTPFDLIWLMRPDRRALLMPYRLWLGPVFLLFVIPAAFASFGFFQHRSWARELAIAIFAANGVGDVVQIARGHTWEGALGAAVMGLLIFFLTSQAARAEFERS
jgi:hypothetical protein